jgi:ABC-type lipoprotein release transport system permease subunit
VGAVRMRLQAELRGRWRTWLTLAVLAGLAGGVIVAAVAGARRTDSALSRHVVAYSLPHVTITEGDPSVRAQIAALPEVEASTYVADLAYVARDTQNRPVLNVGPRAMAVQLSLDGRDGSALSRWKLLAGRHPDATRPNEALLDSRAAETLGVEPGDQIQMWADGDVRLKVVGVRAATDTAAFPGGVVRLTPAFSRLHQAAQYNSPGWMSIRLRHGAADIPAFRDGVAAVSGALFRLQRDENAKVQHSIHLQVQALWLAVAVGTLLAFVLLAQALARVAAFATLDHPTLRAVGMSPRQFVALGVARAGVIALMATAVAVGVGAALSPLTPIGLAGELEPDPGFAFDSLAIGSCAAATLAAILVTGALAAWRSARTQTRLLPSQTAASATAGTLARWGFPPTLVSGVRLALSRGRGPTAVPVGATLLGGILAVTAAVTALTVSASLDHLFSTPRLFGQTWDYEVLYNHPFERRQIAADARADPAISALALGASTWPALVNGRRVTLRAMDDLKGELPPVVLEGRAPKGTDEILLGTKTLRALGLELGDPVTVEGPSLAIMRIVGRGVVAAGAIAGSSVSSSPGDGAAITWHALGEIAPGIPGNCCAQVQARFVPGADRQATLARLTGEVFDLEPGLPKAVGDFGGVDELPLVLSALLVAMASGALAHTLVMAIRRRRHELAILKTLGFDRRQVLATVAWQASTFAAVGLLVGLPLGLAAGRWAWNLFANEIGVVPEPVTSLPLILLVVPGAFLVANLVAAIPARIAAGTRPALALRTE